MCAVCASHKTKQCLCEKKRLAKHDHSIWTTIASELSETEQRRLFGCVVTTSQTNSCNGVRLCILFSTFAYLL